MIILISAIILLGIVTYYFHRLDLKKQVEKTNKIVQTKIQEPPQECCGPASRLRTRQPARRSKQNNRILRRRRARCLERNEPDSYTPEQIELFREIFYTLRPEDVPGWVRSLQLRQIAVPESLRDEILLVVNEQRTIDK